MDNKENELFNGIIDVPVEQPKPESFMPNNQDNLEYNFNFETQVESTQVTNNGSVASNQMPSFEQTQAVQFQTVDVAKSIETVSQPETIDFNTNVSEGRTVNLEMPSMLQQMPEEKQVNEELLKNLTADTNNFVNPDLIVNPSAKAIEQQPDIIEEESTENPKEVNNKKKTVFMIIVFAIIALFIAFLPTIAKLLGF